MRIKIPYGKSSQEVNISEKKLLGVLTSKNVTSVKSERLAIKKAIENPIGTKNLMEMVKASDKVVIVINDITRPGPTRIMVEEIAAQLQKVGIKNKNIKLVVATGSHKTNNLKELEMMVGKELVERFEIENHECEDDNTLKYVGTTERGIPLYLNKTVVEADIRILTGVIVPHHSAGFSGGRKSILPGVAGIKTLKIHHSLPIRPYEPSMGRMYGNAFHEEAVSAAKMVGVDFIVNIVQNYKKETISVVAGDLVQAHEEGVKLSLQSCSVKLLRKADIVITSPGGYPRDINLYQAQKAVSVAENVVKEGGVIILVAECPEGIERNDFLLWMKAASNPLEVVERFRKEGYSVGSNKAFMFSRALLKCKIIVVTDKMPEKELKTLFLQKATSLEEAYVKACKIIGKEGETIVLPNASTIIPL